MPSAKLLVRLTLLLALGTLAEAVPVTWYLSGVTMSDGAVANGSFTFDASTNTYSGIYIRTAGGTVFTGATYTAVDPSQIGFVNSIIVVSVPNPTLGDFTGTPVLVLIFSTPLTNAGGTVGLTAFPGPSYETTCADAGCNGPGLTRRNFTAGVVTSAAPAAPVPALSNMGMGTLALLLLASSVLVLRRRAS